MTQDRNPPPRARPGRARRVHGAVVWDLARRAYHDGADPRVICERYGLNRSTFRDRARREGWRRKDILDEAKPWTRMDENTMELRRSDLIVTAWTHAARAVARGKRLEARSWLAVVRDLGASLAMLDRAMEPDGADPALPADPARASGVTGVSAESPCSTESTASDPLPADSAVPAPQTPATVRPALLGRSPPAPAEPAPSPAPEAVPLQAAPPPHAPAPPPVPPPTVEPEPDAPAPWAALLARPDEDTTGAERAARVRARPIYRLWNTDRPEARRRWTALVEQLGIDPERPLTPPPPRPAPTGFRAVLR